MTHQQHSSEHIAPLTTPTPAQQHYLALARGDTRPTRCTTPTCDSTAKAGTAHCGNCHIARGTYWNATTPAISTPTVTERSAVASRDDSKIPNPKSKIELPAIVNRDRSPQSTIVNHQSSIGHRRPSLCTATTRSGSPCRFAARRETGLCINHDPAYREQQTAHRQRGAQASVHVRRQPHINLEDLDLSTRTGIQAALETIVRLDLEGRLSQPRTRTLVRSLALAARNFNTPSAHDRRIGAPATHAPQTFDTARRRCLTALFALLPVTNENP